MKMAKGHGIALVQLMLLCIFCTRNLIQAANVSCTVADQQLWEESEFAIVEVNLQECGFKSLGLEDEARECLIRKSQLSTKCIDCQVDLISCTVEFCTASCASGGRSNANCVNCVNNNSPCNERFTTCTGFSFPECSTCVQRAREGPDGFIPNTTLGASIGIVVGAAVGALILVGVSTWLLCIRDNREDFNPSRHSLPKFGSQGDLKQDSGSLYSNGSPVLSPGKQFHQVVDNYYDGPAYAAPSNVLLAQAVPAGNIMDDI